MIDPMARLLTASWLGAVALLLVGAPAQATGGTEEQRMACMTDAMTYCSTAIPDERRIEACLRRRSRQISAACRTELGLATGIDGDRGSPPSN